MKKIFSLTASIACALAVLSNPILSSTVEAQDTMMIDQGRAKKAKDVAQQIKDRSAKDFDQLRQVGRLEDACIGAGFKPEWYADTFRGTTEGNTISFTDFQPFFYPRPLQITVVIVDENQYDPFWSTFYRPNNGYPRVFKKPHGFRTSAGWTGADVKRFNEEFRTFTPSMRIQEVTAPLAFETAVAQLAQSQGLEVKDVVRAAKTM